MILDLGRSMHSFLLIINLSLLLLSAKAISARIANGLVILLESALMWQSVTIVAFQGKKSLSFHTNDSTYFITSIHKYVRLRYTPYNVHLVHIRWSTMVCNCWWLFGLILVMIFHFQNEKAL